MSERPANIALLIDADNASPETLESVLTILAELGSVNIRRAYGNWTKPALKGWMDKAARYALDPRHQFDPVKGKSVTDMKMTIEAMDLLAGGQIDGFGMMSSDSDFTPLAMRIRESNLPVYGFGTAKTPMAFQEACTRFIDVSARPQGETAPDNGGPAAKIDAGLIELLGDALKASKRDERGYASLSELGQRASARSSFDARSYGFSRLSELIEAIPNFAIERREGGSVFVKRVH